MDSAPGIPTDDDTLPYEIQSHSELLYAPETVALNQQLNSFVEIPYSNPSIQRGARLAAGIDDTDFNMGYKMHFVDNQVSQLGVTMEAPDVGVTNLPWRESLYKSSMFQEQVPDKLYNSSLRAPAINEGFQ